MLPNECSGYPPSCPENEGTGCYCSRTRNASRCKRSHPHESMGEECHAMTLFERAAAKRRSQPDTPETGGGEKP